MLQGGEGEEAGALRERAEGVLREWRAVLRSPLTELELAQNFGIYVHRMNMAGILACGDTLTRFLRVATQLCVEGARRQLREAAGRELAYATCDAFARLLSLLVRTAADPALPASPAPKLDLLNKALGVLAARLLHDHEAGDFQPLPVHRLLLMLFLDLNVPEPVLEAINYQVSPRCRLRYSLLKTDLTIHFSRVAVSFFFF